MEACSGGGCSWSCKSILGCPKSPEMVGCDRMAPPFNKCHSSYRKDVKYAMYMYTSSSNMCMMWHCVWRMMWCIPRCFVERAKDSQRQLHTFWLCKRFVFVGGLFWRGLLSWLLSFDEAFGSVLRPTLGWNALPASSPSRMHAAGAVAAFCADPDWKLWHLGDWTESQHDCYLGCFRTLGKKNYYMRRSFKAMTWAWALWHPASALHDFCSRESKSRVLCEFCQKISHEWPLKSPKSLYFRLFECHWRSAVIVHDHSSMVPHVRPLWMVIGKAAVMHLTKISALDLAPSNVRVNSISPVGGRTEWLRGWVEVCSSSRCFCLQIFIDIYKNILLYFFGI